MGFSPCFDWCCQRLSKRKQPLGEAGNRQGYGEDGPGAPGMACATCHGTA